MPDAPAIVGGVPDWSTQTEEIFCPLCSYNLRGLSESRCPECGYRFEWAGLTDPNRRLHPYLFEHHPERNIASFVQTVVGHLMPRRFWRSLNLEMPSRTGRLTCYWAIQIVFVLACIVAHCSLYVVERGWYAYIIRHPPAGTYWARSPMPKAAADYYHPEVFSRRFIPVVWNSIVTNSPRNTDLVILLPCTVLFLLWPWLTLLIMQVFRRSIRRTQIRWVHLMRSLLYSTDFVIWLCIPYVCWKLWPLTQADYSNLRVYNFLHKHPPYWAIYLASAAVVILYRVFVAFKLYLKLDRSLLTLLATQLVLLFIIIVAIDVIPGLSGLVYLVYVNR